MVWTRRKIIITSALALLLVLGCLVFFTKANGRSTLNVTTDAASLKLEIGDQTYEINNKKTVIRLKPAEYAYRAISTIDGNRIVLSDKINLADKKSANLALNFSIYNNQAVSDALCKSIGEDPCPISPQILKVVFLENYQWAVATINSPDLGKANAVLRINNGSWLVVDGPATNIETAGIYPSSVERAVENEQ